MLRGGLLVATTDTAPLHPTVYDALKSFEHVSEAVPCEDESQRAIVFALAEDGYLVIPKRYMSVGILRYRITPKGLNALAATEYHNKKEADDKAEQKADHLRQAAVERNAWLRTLLEAIVAVLVFAAGYITSVLGDTDTPLRRWIIELFH